MSEENGGGSLDKKTINLYPWVALLSDGEKHVLYDLLQKEMFLLTDKEYAALQKPQPGKTRRLGETLAEKRLGYLSETKIYTDTLEAGNPLTEYMPVKPMPPILRADIVLTNICHNEFCNLCSQHLLGGYYCFSCLLPRGAIKTMPKYMDIERYLKLLRFLKTLDISTVKLLGGDLLVKKDFDRYVNAAASKFNSVVLVLPHYIIYREDSLERISFLKEYGNINLVLTHNLNPKFIEEINRLTRLVDKLVNLARSVSLSIGFPTDKLTESDIEATYQLLTHMSSRSSNLGAMIYPITSMKRLGTGAFRTIGKVVSAWISPPDVYEFAVFKKHVHCMYSSITIDMNGSIAPCKAFIGTIPAARFDGNCLRNVLEFIVERYWTLGDYIYGNFAQCGSCALRVACRRCQFIMDILISRFGNCPIRATIGGKD